MAITMNTVFKLFFIACKPDWGLSAFLTETIQKDIARFKILSLPINNRIAINILSEEEFYKRRSLSSKKVEPFSSALAYVDSSIHAIQFPDISPFFSREAYLKMIRHECVHVLQLLASQVRPTSLEWLYESVACAVAEQQQVIGEPIPSWETFSQCFYIVPNCYAIAYQFGIKLLDHYSIPEILQLSKSRDKCVTSCRQLYQNLFSR